MKTKSKILTSLLITGLTLSIFSLAKLTDSLAPCANPGSCNALPTYESVVNGEGTFQGRLVQAPNINSNTTLAQVLGESVSLGEKHIYVDLDNQTLKAYDGDTLFMEALVSTGKWGRTPKGEFDIWVKLKSTRMSGGSGADYYNLPNVPYTMFFYNKDVRKEAGFSFHGAYWHNNFGHPMSHGCVNMRAIDAEKLYNWATPETKGNTTHATKDNPGTKVTIY